MDEEKWFNGDTLHYKKDKTATSSPASGSVSDNEDTENWKLERGFWVKSKTTGRLSAPGHIQNSDIDCVLIEGEWFERK